MEGKSFLWLFQCKLQNVEIAKYENNDGVTFSMKKYYALSPTICRNGQTAPIPHVPCSLRIQTPRPLLSIPGNGAWKFSIKEKFGFKTWKTFLIRIPRRKDGIPVIINFYLFCYSAYIGATRNLSGPALL